ncbi:MAG: phytoene desaturase family protein [Halobacteria archaeon]
MRRRDVEGLDVTVVGGGFGGLSAASYLAYGGANVELLEKNDELGGRASTLKLGKYKFDMGPSWYLMPDVFERFFENLGKKREDYYELKHLDPHYRIYFKDGDRIDISADTEEVKELFDSYEDGAGSELESYLETSEKSYEIAMEDFVYTDRPGIRDWIDLDVLKAAPIGLKMVKTMDSHVENYFNSSKLRKITQYTLVFLGGSPSRTPALYNMMSHVDFNLGVYYPEGGMTGVADCIADLAEELDVDIKTEVEVNRISNHPDGVVVQTGERDIKSDVVVSDADYHHTEMELLDKEDRSYDEDYWREKTLAPSAFLIYLGVEGELPEISHHTLVLPNNWNSHFDSIFENESWPENPAYYVCNPSITDDLLAPDGNSAIFVLVPIASGLEDTENQRKEFREKIIEDLEENTGINIKERIKEEEIFTVSEFSDRYNSYQGTALGLAHTLRQTALLRPSQRSSNLQGLYYTGSYTTPGIGVPMCLVSGEHTSDKIKEDYGTKSRR